jgi:outer membrane lipoprotein-sorting protein
LQRVNYTGPEDDGILGATFYFDRETWLQVGSILVDKDDQTIARYFFRDVEVNPDFSPGTFTRAALEKK